MAEEGDLSADAATVRLVPHDPGWADRFDDVAREITGALGPAARAVLHVGSTAVPGLEAKPVIDVVLVVPDSSAESAHLDALRRKDFPLVVREPEWYGHRMLQRPAAASGHAGLLVNLHVFSAGCPEVDRMVAFRDWLRNHPDDRERYAARKRALAARDWPTVQAYADAKSAVVTEILERALPCPQPRNSA